MKPSKVRLNGVHWVPYEEDDSGVIAEALGPLPLVRLDGDDIPGVVTLAREVQPEERVIVDSPRENTCKQRYSPVINNAPSWLSSKNV